MVLNHSKKLKFNIFASVCMGLVGFAILGIATNNVNAAVNLNAFSNKLTNPGDVKAGGSKGAVDLHLKNVDDIAKIPKNSLAAYFPSGVKKTKGLKLQIQDGRKGRVCNINTAVATGYIKITISAKTNSKKEVYSVPIKDVCGTNKFFGKTLNFPDDDVIKETGLGKADITVEFTGGPKTSAALGGTDKYSLNYNLQLVGSNSGKAVLALKAGQDIGLRSSYKGKESSASDRRVEAATVFGYPCDTSPASTVVNQRAVTLYDVDEGFGSTYFWIEKDGSSLSRGDYNEALSQREGDWKDISSLVGGSGTTKAWRVEYGDQETVKLVMTTGMVDINAKYRVFVLNTGKKHNGDTSDLNPHGNTISITIPFDSIYGSGKCNYELSPEVDPPKKSGESFVEGAVVPVKGHISFEGDDIDTHLWQLTKRVFKKFPNGRGADTNNNVPCDWKGGNVGACEVLDFDTRKFKDDFTVSYNFDTTGVAPGNWVCFMMSVQKPKYNAPDTKWSHSQMKCIGVKGDVSGTTVDPLTYSYYPDIDVTSIADNLGNYPYVDEFLGEEYKRKYPWKIIEAKFTAMPTSSIGEASGNACDVIQANYSSTLIAGSCKDDVNTGDDLFPDDSPKQKVTANDVQKNTPDPIGTWTCYTMRYRNNPRPEDTLKDDIDARVLEWNDYDDIDESGRWGGDGYYREWEDTSYTDPVTGNYVSSGHWNYYGSQKNAGTIWQGYLDDNGGSSPAKFTYTDYERTSCSVAGINPKVQVQGGDLRANGDIIARTTDITPPAQYRGQYGSFGEYGLMAGYGEVIGMASGAGFNGSEGLGASQFDWSALTFSNETEYGKFETGVTHSFNYTNPIEVTGDLTVSSMADLYTPESRRHVYVVEGNLYIAGNLAYGNNYNTTEQLPRIAIKANNIIVAPGVDRVDPWLITDGVLNTCGDTSFDPDDDNSFSNTILTTSDAQNSQCDNNGVPLVFNGPVVAGRVFLLRTAGSRDSYPAPSADGRKSLSQPAEIFNIRPDAYLSSFSNNVTPRPVAATDRVIDLPPRF